MIELIDKGVYTPLPNELRKLKRQLEKKAISYGQADNLLIAIGQKYGVFNSDIASDALQEQLDLHITPDIVITETFFE